MESHVCSPSVQLWRVIKDGFKPHDPKNLTPSEVVDEQLNATAKHMIQKAMTEDSVAHIRALNTAKEAWDYLVDLYDGNTSMKRSKKAILQQQVNDFIMKDEETPEELFEDSNLSP
jgi:alpha-galactosidase